MLFHGRSLLFSLPSVSANKNHERPLSTLPFIVELYFHFFRRLYSVYLSSGVPPRFCWEWFFQDVLLYAFCVRFSLQVIKSLDNCFLMFRFFMKSPNNSFLMLKISMDLFAQNGSNGMELDIEPNQESPCCMGNESKTVVQNDYTQRCIKAKRKVHE